MSLNFSAYRNGQHISGLPLDNISDLLEEPDGFVWLTMADPTAQELAKIEEEFNLHELAMEDARSAHQRPKLEDYGDILFLTFHTVALEGGTTLYGELHAFIGQRFVILIQHGGHTRYDRIKTRCEAHPAQLRKGPGFVLYALLDFLVDQFLQVADYQQKQLDGLEDDIFASNLDGPLIERLYGLKREVATLRDAAAPVGDICTALLRLHTDLIAKDLRPYYRDVQDHIVRVIRGTERLRETLSDAMQVNLALVTVRQNEVVKRLAGWGAILAIPTMVFSMYGMNFETMPELQFEYGYPTAMIFTGLGCGLLYRQLRRAGWL
jgi:magnesium transporter